MASNIARVNHFYLLLVIDSKKHENEAIACVEATSNIPTIEEQFVMRNYQQQISELQEVQAGLPKQSHTTYKRMPIPTGIIRAAGSTIYEKCEGYVHTYI